jgi:hypothetical protein
MSEHRIRPFQRKSIYGQIAEQAVSAINNIYLEPDEFWPKCEVLILASNVRVWERTGKHMLALSSSHPEGIAQ